MLTQVAKDVLDLLDVELAVLVAVEAVEEGPHDVADLHLGRVRDADRAVRAGRAAVVDVLDEVRHRARLRSAGVAPRGSSK
jgi:hypothetical protein